MVDTPPRPSLRAAGIGPTGSSAAAGFEQDRPASAAEREQLRDALQTHTAASLGADRIVFAGRSAGATVGDPGRRRRQRSSEQRQGLPDVDPNRRPVFGRSWEQEGKTLAALNASMFAGNLSDQARHVCSARDAAWAIARSAHGAAKASPWRFNPVPIADLVAAAVVDGARWCTLRAYGLPLSRNEAGGLVKTPSVLQMLLLMVPSGRSTWLPGTEARHRRRFGNGNWRCAGCGRLLQHLCRRTCCRALSGERQIVG